MTLRIKCSPLTPLAGLFGALANVPLKPVRDWLDAKEVRDPKFALWLCKVIPADCPFERDVRFLGRTLFHIPPLCKLNPLYDQLMGLKFRAMTYLAEAGIE
jgi:hypothetical protein